jgi:hypothetical protein
MPTPSGWVGIWLLGFCNPAQSEGPQACEAAEAFTELNSVNRASKLDIQVFQVWQRYVEKLEELPVAPAIGPPAKQLTKMEQVLRVPVLENTSERRHEKEQPCGNNCAGIYQQRETPEDEAGGGHTGSHVQHVE